MSLHARQIALIVTTVVGLVACGGGGGGDDSGGGSTTGPYALSGRILVAPTAAVDSDSNDVRQSPYTVNDTQGTAQPLRTPVFLAGTVNEVGKGPAGNNQSSGDVDDYFVADLVVGQTVELEFADDTSVSDIDLYLDSTDGVRSGVSEGVDTRYECVNVNHSGRYYINVFAFRGASIYNLKIGAPGSANGCAASTTADRSAPGQLLAQARPVAAPLAQAVAGRLKRAGVSGAALATTASSAAALPHLLKLPADTAARRDGLQLLAGRTVSKSLGGASTASRSAAAPVGRAELLKYAKQLRATGAFEYVQPNWISERMATVGLFPPNDRAYGYQRWHYEQINLPAAMSRINGLAAQPTARPVVAVIDDGVVLDHPDLTPAVVLERPRLHQPSTAEGDGNDCASGDNTSGPGRSTGVPRHARRRHRGGCHLRRHRRRGDGADGADPAAARVPAAVGRACRST